MAILALCAEPELLLIVQETGIVIVMVSIVSSAEAVLELRYKKEKATLLINVAHMIYSDLFVIYLL